MPPDPTKPSPGWTAPEQIAAHSEKFLYYVGLPREGLLVQDPDAYDATCWLWRGKVRPDGQAFVYVSGSRVPIHRFSYLLWTGDVPEGQFARPLICGEKLCVAPHHLRLRERGFHLRKLDEKQEADVRSLYYSDNAEWSHQRLASTFGVSRQLITQLVRRNLA